MSVYFQLRLFKGLPPLVAWLALSALPCVLARYGLGPSAKPQDTPAQNAGGNKADGQGGSTGQPVGDELEGPRPARKGQGRQALPKKVKRPGGASAAALDQAKKETDGPKTAATSGVATETHAPSPEEVRRSQLARLSPKERQEKIEATGRARWKKAGAAHQPEIRPGEPGGHFVLFSILPKDRATNLARGMETQHGLLRKLVGAPAMNWAEKVSLYVFNDRKDFVEFLRSVENREAEPGLSASGNLTVAQPYVAVVDPLGGKKEEPTTPRHRPRGKRSDEKEAASKPERTLAGLCTETLGQSVVLAHEKSPRWLSLGLGTVLASRVEPHSPYYQRLREQAREKYGQGWETKANEALGESEQAGVEDLRAVGFAIVEAILNSDLRGAFPAFARGMGKGKEKLDDILKDVYGMTREDFLNQTGDWVASRYGQDQ